jgi:hypothetical protein
MEGMRRWFLAEVVKLCLLVGLEGERLGGWMKVLRRFAWMSWGRLSGVGKVGRDWKLIGEATSVVVGESLGGGGSMVLVSVVVIMVN